MTSTDHSDNVSYDPETVRILVAAAERVVNAEVDRRKALVDRGAAYIGFAGLVLTVEGVLAKFVEHIGLSSDQKTVEYLALVASAGSLLLGAAWVLRTVLWPVEEPVFKGSEVDSWTRPPLIKKPPAEVEGRLLRGWSIILNGDPETPGDVGIRASNDRRSSGLRVGFSLFILGLGFIALGIFVVGWHREGGYSAVMVAVALLLLVIFRTVTAPTKRKLVAQGAPTRSD